MKFRRAKVDCEQTFSCMEWPIMRCATIFIEYFIGNGRWLFPLRGMAKRSDDLYPIHICVCVGVCVWAFPLSPPHALGAHQLR